jgi:hypothetical protein
VQTLLTYGSSFHDVLSPLAPAPPRMAQDPHRFMRLQGDLETPKDELRRRLQARGAGSGLSSRMYATTERDNALADTRELVFDTFSAGNRDEMMKLLHKIKPEQQTALDARKAEQDTMTFATLQQKVDAARAAGVSSTAAGASLCPSVTVRFAIPCAVSSDFVASFGDDPEIVEVTYDEPFGQLMAKVHLNKTVMKHPEAEEKWVPSVLSAADGKREHAGPMHADVALEQLVEAGAQAAKHGVASDATVGIHSATAFLDGSDAGLSKSATPLLFRSDNVDEDLAGRDDHTVLCCFLQLALYLAHLPASVRYWLLHAQMTIVARMLSIVSGTGYYLRRAETLYYLVPCISKLLSDLGEQLRIFLVRNISTCAYCYYVPHSIFGPWKPAAEPPKLKSQHVLERHVRETLAHIRDKGPVSDFTRLLSIIILRPRAVLTHSPAAPPAPCFAPAAHPPGRSLRARKHSQAVPRRSRRLTVQCTGSSA